MNRGRRGAKPTILDSGVVTTAIKGKSASLHVKGTSRFEEEFTHTGKYAHIYTHT